MTSASPDKKRPSAEELLAQAARKKERSPRRDPCIRAENEDDDGYDPYSDRTERTPMFERDPWV